MPKQNVTEQKKESETPATTTEPETSVETAEIPVVKEPLVRIPANMTLADLLGDLVVRVVSDRRYMPQARKDLNLWYQGQDIHNRKEIAKEAMHQADTLRLLADGIFSHMSEITSADRA